ncbi:NlpC/P60 family protein [Rhizobium sp. BK060]|uniref:C40 family peptidase n=1 Tax=Rhizobium sp. BK060 TaxID=2587096 RepID=UPI00160E0A19|nr:NlpC/P60 family protein [Rhizobium sp. BK060]MBB3396881.1 cell wall-associated NlpC family hydrolase [Rhizobium sp. BK060]
MEKFIGIPYVPHGREYKGADCWGILFLYYRDVLGTPVPAYSSEMEAREFNRCGIAPLIGEERERRWHQVETPQAGDCVLMRAGRHDSHVGVYLGQGRMLHSEGPHPSVIDRISDMRWRNRISGFYRLNECSQS